MADRSLLEIALITTAGDARTSKVLTFFEEDGVTPLAQSLYAAQSGGAPLVGPFNTNANGTFRAYVDNPQRGTALASDDATQFPVAYNPDPVDFILTGQSNRYLASLAVGTNRVPEAPLGVYSPYNDWSGAAITRSITGIFGALGNIELDDVHWPGSPEIGFAFGVLGVIDVPAAATSLAANSHGVGAGGWAQTGGARNAVGVWGEALPTAASTGGGVFGGNLVVTDQSTGGTNWPYLIYGLEVDVNPYNVGSTAYAIVVAGNTTTGTSIAGITHDGLARENSRGVTVQPLLDGANQVKFRYGVHVQSGGAVSGVYLGQTLTTGGVAHPSMPIELEAYDATNASTAWLRVNSLGEFQFRNGHSATPSNTIAHFQANTNDLTAAGTTHLIVTKTGIGVNLPAVAGLPGTPGKRLETYSATAGFPIGARFTNYDANANSGVAIGFDVTGGGETQGAKAGLGLERTATFGRGKLHFLMDNTADASEIALADSAGHIAPDGGWVVGAGASIGAGTLLATGVMHSRQGTATAAGGAQALRLGASGPHIYVGSGAPTVSAAKGSLYLRTDGTTTNDRAYIATDAAGTWTALTTVA